MSMGVIFDFIKNIHPFEDVSEDELRTLSAEASIRRFPKGFFILHQDGPASSHLMLVREGIVKVFILAGQGEEVVVDYRAEGETFGFLSILSGDKSRANVMAVEDTVCYLFPRSAVLRLLETSPSFSEFFLVSFFEKYIHKTYEEVHGRSLLYGGGDKLLFTTPVGEVVKRPPVTASKEISIRDAAEVMSQNRISSLVLTDSDDVAVGIVTDRDLRDKVIARKRDITGSIQNVMSISLVKEDAKNYCFDALLKMIRYNIHHLLVVEGGKLRGVITNHDLMMLQGTSPISVVRDIEAQSTVEGLVPASRNVNKIIDLLMKEGAKAGNITKIITEINDRLLRRILELAEKSCGEPPLRYCWIVFGSEGRKEQTFRTDQDNAIIYEDPESGAEAAEATEYFSRFAAFVRDGLVACGFPLCPAHYMASNSQWCQPLKVWRRYFSSWIHDPVPEAVLRSLIFFDFRPVYGYLPLAESLRDYLVTLLASERLFLGHMANTIIGNMPPLGFFGSFIVDKEGEHKDHLNLKVKGVAPIVDIVRLFSLEKGVRETSTLDRIGALRQRHAIVDEHGEEIEHAFEFLMLFRIRHQLAMIQAGKNPDNYVSPAQMTNLQRKGLREAFSLISSIHGMITELYKPMIW